MIEWLAGLRIMKEVPGLAAWAESIVAEDSTRRCRSGPRNNHILG